MPTFTCEKFLFKINKSLIKRKNREKKLNSWMNRLKNFFFSKKSKNTSGTSGEREKKCDFICVISH